MAHEYGEMRSDSITDVLRRVVDDIRELFREEVALARVELRQEASSYTTAAAQIGAGAAAGAFAIGFLLLGIAQGFAMLVGWPAWGGYLAMGILLGIVALIAVQMGRSRMAKTPAVPARTAETLQETREWIKDRMNSEPR